MWCGALGLSCTDGGSLLTPASAVLSRPIDYLLSFQYGGLLKAQK